MSRANGVESRVRRLEAMQGGGGAGRRPRPRLWQVTAVDTTAGTCTVQGVRWDGDSLVTDSTREKQEVLYDPNNPPSTGDRGHLKGLSGGDLFFFKKRMISAWRSPSESKDIEETGGAAGVHCRQAYDGNAWSTTEDTLALFKMEDSLPIRAQERITCRVGPNSNWWPYVQFVADTERTGSYKYTSIYLSWIIEFLFITEEFALGDINSRAEVNNLTNHQIEDGLVVSGDIHWVDIQGQVINNGGRGSWSWKNASGSTQQVYGFALQCQRGPADFQAGAEGLYADDRRSVDVNVGGGDTDTFEMIVTGT